MSNFIFKLPNVFTFILQKIFLVIYKLFLSFTIASLSKRLQMSNFIFKPQNILKAFF
ncbi:hypothetical protein AsAng_0049450 [Aureispira anguillae]|uniref:Uncharacterized protein n=1 Tax=Aureispira anguillae TaxID=2864201 RepID=A0A915YJJ9_9BACT|nr:hypothetical protein AsAng_0049450 [Aureispira anguillae]